MVRTEVASNHTQVNDSVVTVVYSQLKNVVYNPHLDVDVFSLYSW